MPIRAYYSARVSGFLEEDAERILGVLGLASTDFNSQSLPHQAPGHATFSRVPYSKNG